MTLTTKIDGKAAKAIGPLPDNHPPVNIHKVGRSAGQSRHAGRHRFPRRCGVT